MNLSATTNTADKAIDEAFTMGDLFSLFEIQYQEQKEDESGEWATKTMKIKPPKQGKVSDFTLPGEPGTQERVDMYADIVENEGIEALDEQFDRLYPFLLS